MDLLTHITDRGLGFKVPFGQDPTGEVVPVAEARSALNFTPFVCSVDRIDPRADPR
jgi:hypothetical protein